MVIVDVLVVVCVVWWLWGVLLDVLVIVYDWILVMSWCCDLVIGVFVFIVLCWD